MRSIDRDAFSLQAHQSLEMMMEMTSKLDMLTCKWENISQTPLIPKLANQFNFDPRFAILDYPLDSLAKNEQSKQKVAVWCGLMAKEVFASSFNLFLKGSLDDGEAKSYASANFLNNFQRLAKWVDLSQEQLKQIDEKLKGNILPYLKEKYPQSKTLEVNLALQEKVKKINDLQNNQNDLFFRTRIKFQLSEKKQYDSQIMRFLNKIIQIPSSEGKIKKIQAQYRKKEVKKITTEQSEWMQEINQQTQENSKNAKSEQNEEEENRKTLYSQFDEYFTKLFEKLYFKKQVAQMERKGRKIRETKQFKEGDQQNRQNNSTEQIDQEYKEKVQQYTKFYINRKLSPNIKKFSDEQILEGNLRLKDSALMRVVTKWCKELRKNFKEPHLIAYKHSQFQMADGSQRYLSHKEANALQILLERRQDEIKEWLLRVRENNLSHQQQFSKKNVAEDPDFQMLSEQESFVGMFAAVNQRNYEFYLIGYLKELIHQCLKVMDQFQSLCYQAFNYAQNISKTNIDLFIKEGEEKKKKRNKQSKDSKAINLITFKVGDLFRCKCSSKQKEITALYTYLHRISQTTPDILKIVKIKNRLEKGTKDVLLNLMFQKKILVEIQLSIDTGKNKFIECSDKFNHYIYEVQRAEFGPISELCSIWMKKDPRANFFRKRFQDIHRPNFLHHQLQKNTQSKSLTEKVSFPFFCSLCNRYGISQNFDDQHCFHCVLEKNDYQQIKQMNPTFKNLPDVSEAEQKVERIKYKKGESSFQFPNQGLVMNLKQKKQKVEFFKCIQRGKKKFLMIKEKQSHFKKIGEISTDKQKQLFLQDNLVFCHAQFLQETKLMKEQQIIKQYFIPETFETIKKEQKASIRIMNDGLNDEHIEKQAFNFVKSANLSENQLTNLNLIVKKFPKAEKLILNNNNFNGLRMEQNMKGLKEFNISSAKIEDIDEDSVRRMKGLEILLIGKNQIKKLPASFGQLTNLLTLNLENNELSQLPASFGELANIKTLNLQNNKISELPHSFALLSNLSILNLSHNQLAQLPPSFGSLVNIRSLHLSRNQLKQLPPSFGELANLHSLDLDYNKVLQLPLSFGGLKNLHTLHLHSNQLTELPPSFGELANLKTLHLSENKLNQLPPSFGSLVRLHLLNLSHNQLTQLPPSFHKLQRLTGLSLCYNKLGQLSDGIGELRELTSLEIYNNELISMPDQIGELTKLQVLSMEGNKFDSLPESFTNLKDLRRLTLDQEKMNEKSAGIIKEIIDRGVQVKSNLMFFWLM